MTFSDYAEVAPGLFVGAHPEHEDPFDLVCERRRVPRIGHVG